MKVWQRQPDPPVPERDQVFDRALDRSLEMGIDPRVVRGCSRSPERDEGFRKLQQIVDPRIDALGVCNDQSVGEAAFGQPAQRAEAVVATLKKDRKVETVLAEPALQPVEDERNTVLMRVLSVPLGTIMATRSVRPRRRLRPD